MAKSPAAIETSITEPGVPRTTKPAKYGWLGDDLNATELSSGVVVMGARSYVPQIGRFLQTDPVPGGSANAYAYTYGDPVDSSDASGEYTAEFDSAGGEVAAGVGAGFIAERKAAEEAAARAVAEKEAEEAAFWTHAMEPKGSELPEPPEPVTETLGVGFETGSGNASEARNFYHQIEVSPFTASELGDAIFFAHNLGQVSSGFTHIPSWLIQIVDTAVDKKLVGGLDGLAENLKEAGNLAEGPVTITGFGSLTSVFWVDVTFETDVGIDGEG
jgi:RHS repeat-associated protein